MSPVTRKPSEWFTSGTWYIITGVTELLDWPQRLHGDQTAGMFQVETTHEIFVDSDNIRTQCKWSLYKLIKSLDSVRRKNICITWSGDLVAIWNGGKHVVSARRDITPKI